MFLSEWREFTSAPCLAGGKKLDDSSRLDFVEIARVPGMLPSLLTLPNYLVFIQKHVMNSDSAVNAVGSEMNVAASSDFPVSSEPHSRVCV